MKTNYGSGLEHKLPKKFFVYTIIEVATPQGCVLVALLDGSGHAVCCI